MKTNLHGSYQGKYTWQATERVEPPKRPVANRISDFDGASGHYDEQTARDQACRCVQCPHANCVAACPLGTPIVDLLALTADGNFREAAQLLFAANALPEIASHVCVGGRVCESACVLSSRSDPVPIRSITRFLLDYGWKHGLAAGGSDSSTGQRVAVLGSGICGLVAADALSRNGYAVTVIDSRQKPGGRVMNGLPGFRVDKELVLRRLDLLEERGVQFRMGAHFGAETKLSDLRREFGAVFLGLGRAEPVAAELPGSELGGIAFAHDFVMEHAEDQAGRSAALDVRGRRVMVLGGGDTAMDALRTAIRGGARQALCIYRRDEANLAADAEEYTNAVEEGAQFEFLSDAVEFRGDPAGRVVAVRCVHTVLGEPDASGRKSFERIPGTEFEVSADLVLVAYGFTAPRLPRDGGFEALLTDARGRIQVDADQKTNLPGVFAGGSLVRNPAPLAEAVKDARAAAAAIDRFLRLHRLNESESAPASKTMA